MKPSPQARPSRLLPAPLALWALPVLLSFTSIPLGGEARDASPQAGKATAAAAPRYTGPGSCSSTSCHGSIRPRTETRIWQNEYSTWIVKDKHSRAYAALTNPVGLRMGRILGIGRPDTAAKCLACHTLDVPEAERGRTFDLSEGVSCENCHGPAAAWLGPHTTKNWTHEQSLALGMYDTPNLVKRTEKCLTCHLGNPEKFVDHEMIAAGHPDLYFELDSFSAVMPRHWKEPLDQDPWRDVREWGTGQAVQLRADLERLAGRARAKVWPEYSELECFTCHHSLTAAADSWRQERGYPGRRPGDPPWNPSRYAVFRVLVRQVDPHVAEQLDAHLAKVAELMSRLNPDRDAVVSAANESARLTEAIVGRIETLPYDRAMTLRLLRGISGDADEIAGQGERAAEQAAMALDSLFVAYARNAKSGNEAEIRAAINGLFQQVENPSAYNQFQFAKQMKKVNGLLR